MRLCRLLCGLAAVAAAVCPAWAQEAAREFRGAWLSTIFQGQYASQSTERNKEYLSDQLDKLLAAGCNAVIFQVRPQADAFYRSDLEPWSKHLTGAAGVAPSPEWDPLAYMVAEAHARGMELHAWLNPYRVTASRGETLPPGHIYHKHPERFVKYGGKIYFDPGLPENREFIVKVVSDIVSRYDVDAIHLDDYFYPYPDRKAKFPDDKSFAKYGKGMRLADWRRQNVDELIESLHQAIRGLKPWVRLGISPFGIWRNRGSDPEGSDTNGLQCYDDLYADPLLWARNGWIDYLIPQLYWELEHKAAPSEKLVRWWSDHTSGCRLYIGQDVAKTMDTPDTRGSSRGNQLDRKLSLARGQSNVQGLCWWPGYLVTGNYKGVADALASKYQAQLALPPTYPWIDDTPPDPVSGLDARRGGSHVSVSWKAPVTGDPMQVARFFAVYRDGALIALTDATSYFDMDAPAGRHTYQVAVLDRANNQSPSQSVTLPR